MYDARRSHIRGQYRSRSVDTEYIDTPADLELHFPHISETTSSHGAHGLHYASICSYTCTYNNIAYIIYNHTGNCFIVQLLPFFRLLLLMVLLLCVIIAVIKGDAGHYDNAADPSDFERWFNPYNLSTIIPFIILP